MIESKTKGKNEDVKENATNRHEVRVLYTSYSTVYSVEGVGEVNFPKERISFGPSSVDEYLHSSLAGKLSNILLAKPLASKFGLAFFESIESI